MDAYKAYKKRAAEYEKGYQDGNDAGFKDGVQIAIKVMMFQFAQFLGDKRGWNRHSIFRAMRWLNKHADMMIEDYMSFDGVMNQVREEYGIVYDNDQFMLMSDFEYERMRKNVS